MMGRDAPRQREVSQLALAQTRPRASPQGLHSASPTVMAAQDQIHHSPRQTAQRQLIQALMGRAATAPPATIPGQPVAQREPALEAWAEYLLTQEGLEDNPHAVTLQAMRQILEEHGREDILAALRSVEIQQEGDGSDDDSEPEQQAAGVDHEPAFAVIDNLADQLNALNDAVYQTDDVAPISEFISALGLPVTRRIVQAVKDYNYSSTWIDFNPENFHSWIRLSTGRGSIRDAQYLIHEAIEIGELLNVEPEFDPFMTDEEHAESDQADHLSERWRVEGGLYDQAHLVALEYEYRFVAIQVNRVAGTTLDYRDVAAADLDRTEPARLLPAGEDGDTVATAERYAGHATRPVVLALPARQLLNLGEGAVTLSDLVRAVKATPIGAIAQLKRDPSTTPSPIAVAQRVILSIDGQPYDTKEHTIAEIVKLANSLAKTDPTTNKALYDAIEAGEHLEEEHKNEEDDDGYEDYATGEPFTDLLEEFQTSLLVEEPSIHATLLSRDEICNLNHGVEDKELEGFNSDILTQLVSTAASQAGIKRQIAKLVWGVVRMHVFLDGNKRTGQAMLAGMAEKNGLSLGGDSQTLLNNAADAKADMTEEQFITEIGSSVLIGGS